METNECMETESVVEGRTAEQGLPEKEPETIGEALKKYYEEQLSHAGNSNIRVLTPRMAELEKLMTQHCLSFN